MVMSLAEGMLIVQNILNFFIPSGSGQAVVSMPIMKNPGVLIWVVTYSV